MNLCLSVSTLFTSFLRHLSKSIQLIQKLLKKGKKITAFDPVSYESSKIILDKKVKVLVGEQSEPDTMLSLDELSE